MCISLYLHVTIAIMAIITFEKNRKTKDRQARNDIFEAVLEYKH